MKQPVKDGVRLLIIEYFKSDVLAGEPMTSDTRGNIIDTFQHCYNKHLSINAIVKELQGSNLSEFRDRLIKRMGSNYNPFPIRLGNLKPTLQMEAMEANQSLHGYILKLLREREERQNQYIDFCCVPRLNKLYRFRRVHSAVRVCQLDFVF